MRPKILLPVEVVLARSTEQFHTWLPSLGLTLLLLYNGHNGHNASSQENPTLKISMELFKQC